MRTAAAKASARHTPSFPSLLRPPDRVTLYSQDDRLLLSRSGAEARWDFPGGEVSLSGEEELSIWVESPHRPLSALHLRWRQPLAAGARLLGDAWERAYGDLEWRACVPDRPLPWYFLACAGDTTYACGVKTGPAALCFWQVDGGGVSLWVDLRCGGEGVILGGRRLLAATLVDRQGVPGESAFAAGKAFLRLLCDAPLLPPGPVYGANDFYYAYARNTQADLLRDTATLAELAPPGTVRPYSVVDAGWQFSGDAYGAPWHISNARFPDLPALADGIRSLGCRPGIWFRPLLTTEDLPKTWVLPHDRFEMIGEWGWKLDPSVPETLERISTDVRTFLSWGYELIKHDYSSFDLFGRWGNQMGGEITGRGWSFADRSRTTAEILRGLYAAIRAAAGEALIIGCNTFGHLAAGHVHLQRVGDDTSGKEWARTRKMGVNSLAFRLPQHNALFAIDADCLGLTPAIPWSSNRQWLDLLSRSGTPLFVSLQPESLGPDQRQALRQALEMASQRVEAPAEPLDWMDTTVPQRWQFGNEKVEYDWFLEGNEFRAEAKQ